MKLIVVALTATAALSIVLAPSAAAAPTPPQICAALDADPTPEAVVRILMKRTDPEDPADTELAGQNLAVAVIYTCPEHAPEINAFLEKVTANGSAARAPLRRDRLVRV